MATKKLNCMYKASMKRTSPSHPRSPHIPLSLQSWNKSWPNHPITQLSWSNAILMRLLLLVPELRPKSLHWYPIKPGKSIRSKSSWRRRRWRRRVMMRRKRHLVNTQLIRVYLPETFRVWKREGAAVIHRNPSYRFQSLGDIKHWNPMIYVLYLATVGALKHISLACSCCRRWCRHGGVRRDVIFLGGGGGAGSGAEGCPPGALGF